MALSLRTTTVRSTIADGSNRHSKSPPAPVVAVRGLCAIVKAYQPSTESVPHMPDEPSDYDLHIQSAVAHLKRHPSENNGKRQVPTFDPVEAVRFKTPWDELTNVEPPEFTVEGILPKAQVTWLYGETGIGKSLVATDIALAVCYGRSVFARYETQRTGVLWLDYENGPQEHIARLKAFGHQPEDLQAANQFHIGSLPPSINEQNSTDLANEIEDLYVGLLVIDSSGVGIEGDSNSADTYATLAANLFNPLKRRGVTIMVLDNMGKDPSKKAIGSSRKMHESGAAWKLTEQAGVYTMTCTKRRTLGLEQAIAIKKLSDPLRHVLTTYAITLTPDQQNIVLYLDTLKGATIFPNTTLKMKIREQGLGIKDERIQEAIRWWDRGNHATIE